MRALLILPALALTACAAELPAGYDPLLICHNSNCVEPPDPDDDDTMPALEAGLGLIRDDGRPMIDGVEIDLFWRGSDDTCIFAHDLSQGDAVPATDPADLIMDTLLARRDAGIPLTASGEPFQIFVEVKGHVGEKKSDKHSPAQLLQHAACAVEVLERMAIPADREAIAISMTVTSFDPDLLLEVSRAVADTGRVDSQFVHVGFGALFGIPPPLDSQSQPMDSFTDEIGIEVVSAHPHWISRANLQASRSRGWELGYWMFSTVPETYGAILRDRPRFITTNEANVMTQWMGR